MFITDLDNTLLNEKGLLSEYAIRSIESFDVPFTFATARSLFTAGVVLSYVKMKYPVILLNGAAIYDSQKEEYLHTEPLDEDLFRDILAISNIDPFVIGIKNGKEILLHREPKLEVQRTHLVSRLRYNDKRQTLVEEYPKVDEVLNMVYVDTVENGLILEERLKKFDNINVNRYPKMKDGIEYAYLDVTSKNATKGKAVQTLCNMLNVDIEDVTAFGDDTNDISMLDMVGNPYVVENSKLDYPRIGYHYDEAVIKHIEKEVIKVIKVKNLTYNLDELVEDSSDVFNFVRRLRDEYKTGYNAFNQKGEVLYLALIGDRVIGSCGLNIDPYLNEYHIGRVRHLYILKDYRRMGIATQLLDKILCHAKSDFSLITLRTFSEEASKLYVKNGFTRSDKYKYATHYIEVGG